MKRALVIVAAIAAAAPAHALDWQDFGAGEAPAESPWKDFDAPASPEEMIALGVATDLAEMMRNRTAGAGTLLRGAEGEPPLGLQWPIESTGSVTLVQQLRAELGKRGLVVFVSERNYGTGPDRVAIARAAEPFEVIAKRSVPPALKPEEWVAKLRAWHAKAPWDLLGAGVDWLEIEFREAPADPDRWVDEIVAAAPAVAESRDGRTALRE
ncbi:MAG: hypothetical protein ACREQJ_12890, partial [Candidatus Binatia bacterium]